ncbi:MAG: ATP-grasp domain-containing protein [Methylococcales bacterium]
MQVVRRLYENGEPTVKKNLILVAQSARLLVKSAYRGGWSPWVVDFYGDLDTCRYSEKYKQVTHSKGNVLDNAIVEAITSITDGKEGVALIFGSGFDGRPELIDFLSRHYALYGNGAQTIKNVKQPDSFFALLDRLQIPYPAIRFSKPMQKEGWLLKKGGSEGGRGVWPAGEVDPPHVKKCYYQRRLTGQVGSVLFLADGERHRTIGFNNQWTTAIDSRYPFQFGGIANWIELTDEQRYRLDSYIAAIVHAITLKGLNSLDFIVDGDCCIILEINPRPSASMALYDEHFYDGLVDAHIRACQGDLQSQQCCFELRATSIIFARKSLTVPKVQEWPKWSADRPMEGTVIAAFQPLCSVSASGDRPHDVMRKLKLRGVEMEKQLYRQFA